MSADFVAATVQTVAKRAANICSNPDCGALTSGPAADETRAVNVGEAAHIYGARLKAARYNGAMADGERSAITNAIWLCRNCHKLIDADAMRFPAELLFEWRREHERVVTESLGKAGAVLRQKVLQRSLAGFEDCSYLAQQIVIDRPDHWEYRLTAELLRTLLDPILLGWKTLEKGFYAHPLSIIPEADYTTWQSAQLASLTAQVQAIGGIMNGGLRASWGEPGEPGDPHEILRTCRLLAQACDRLLKWEEAVRFVYVSYIFDDVRLESEVCLSIDCTKFRFGYRGFSKVMRYPVRRNSRSSSISPINGSRALEPSSTRHL